MRPRELDDMHDQADPMLDMLMAYNRLRIHEEAKRDELMASVLAGLGAT